MSADLLTVTGLRLGYGRSDVIHGMSFRVPRGAIVSLVGATAPENRPRCVVFPGCSSRARARLDSRAGRSRERHRTRSRGVGWYRCRKAVKSLPR